MFKQLLVWIYTMLASEDGFAQLANKILGDPIGKIAYAVGAKWKAGKYYIRSRIFPAQRGTIKDEALYEQGNYPAMSYKQMNIRRAVLQVLGTLGRVNLVNWINIVWKDYNDRHPGANPITNMNQMVKANASPLYFSLPDRAIKYNESTNTIDLTKFLASKGDLEPAPSITTAIYNTETGALIITFPENHITNGAGTDLVYAIVLKKPVLDITTWKPTLFLFGPTRGNTKTRADGTVTVTLPEGLTATSLYAYIFFKDAAGTIGYSDSVAKICSAA